MHGGGSRRFAWLPLMQRIPQRIRAATRLLYLLRAQSRQLLDATYLLEDKTKLK
jgi:hypothetical protein